MMAVAVLVVRVVVVRMRVVMCMCLGAADVRAAACALRTVVSALPMLQGWLWSSCSAEAASARGVAAAEAGKA